MRISLFGRQRREDILRQRSHNVIETLPDSGVGLGPKEGNLAWWRRHDGAEGLARWGLTMLCSFPGAQPFASSPLLHTLIAYRRPAFVALQITF
jgi:hypothetical protein